MKKLNSILFLLITIYLMGCSSEKSMEVENSNQPSAENKDFLNKDTIIPFSGFWINEKYYQEILKTKSPKKAQDVVDFSAIEIPEKTLKSTLPIYNFHEGGEEWVVVKHGDNFQFWNADKTEKRDEIEILNTGNKIKIGDDNFIRVKTSFDDRKILEEILFAGKYKLGDKIIEFTELGKIKGWDDFSLYEPLIDYLSPGADVDIIYLDKSKDKRNTYTFNFEEDSLFIFEYKCNNYDSINKDCFEATYGDIKYKMKKIK